MFQQYALEIVELYEKSPFGFPSVDLLFFDPSRMIPRLCVLLSYWAMLRDQKGQFPISSVDIVLPSSLRGKEESIKISILDNLNPAFAILYDRLPDENERHFFKDYLRVISLRDTNIESAVEYVRERNQRAIIILLQATKYRSDSTSPHIPEAQPTLPEDEWVPHLAVLIKEIAAAVIKSNTYVLMDAGEWKPKRPESLEALASTELITIAIEPYDGDWRKYLEVCNNEWNMLVDAGHIDAAIISVEAFSDFSAQEKIFYKIRLLARAGLFRRAIRLMTDLLATPSDFAAETHIELARIAFISEEFELATQELWKAEPEVTQQQSIETAVKLASRIGDSTIEETYLDKLEKLYPNSLEFQERRIEQLIHKRDFDGIKSALADQCCVIPLERASHLQFIATEFSSEIPPDYRAIINETQEKWPNHITWAKLVCIEDATSRRNVRSALEVALTLGPADLNSRNVALYLTQLIEIMLLGTHEIGEEPLAAVECAPLFEKLIPYAAQHPTDNSLRQTMRWLLSPQLSGLIGISVVLTFILELPIKEVRPREGQIVFTDPTIYSLSEIQQSIDDISIWLLENGAVVIGETAIPRDLLRVPPDILINAIEDKLYEISRALSDPENIAEFEQFLWIAVLVAAHSSNPAKGIDLIRIGASIFAESGFTQRSRDLIEAVFLIVGQNQYRLRVAWFSFADAYRRTGNNEESLLALAYAFSYDIEIPPEQAYSEIYLLAQVLWRMGYYDEAKKIVPLAQDYLMTLGLVEANAHRLESLVLSIHLSELKSKQTLQTSELQDLLDKSMNHLQGVISNDDELAPAAMILGEVIHLAELNSVAVEKGIRDALEAACARTGEPIASMIRAFSSAAPTAEQVVMLATSVGSSRYSEDVGFDIKRATIAARRLIASSNANSEALIFGIELLADHAIRLPLAENKRERAEFSLISSLSAPSNFAEELSNRDTDVILMGISDNENLVRITIQNGMVGVAVVEKKSDFSMLALNYWAKRYPYNYGSGELNHLHNDFQDTMRELAFSFSPIRRTLLVLDTTLQRLPPNLLFDKENFDFMGRKTAMASCPSLTWLNASLLSQSKKSTHKLAWIPHDSTDHMAKRPDGQTIHSTLKLMAEWLQPVLDINEIKLISDVQVPDNMNGAELVIIGAHGGVTPDEDFFHSICDEGILKVSSKFLAEHVRDVKLVILFVCSAGRLDTHPMASTSLGLVKELLDAGCSTVIASPWPLEARMTNFWLPAFFDAWNKGQPVIDANYEANKFVEVKYNSSPQHYLAMNVYGNPFLKKSFS